MTYPMNLIKQRPEKSHKGTFGTLKLLCGSEKYTGAALLCCLSALKSGCGIVKLFANEKVCLPVRIALPEVINDTPTAFDSTTANAAVIGCGISKEHDATLENTIKNLNCPSVIDADGLNYISTNINILREANTKIIITPHPMEFSRLSRIDLSEICLKREYHAERFANEYNCTVVLKGHNTIVASPGSKLYVNETGGSALAKGGSGDVLAGFIGSLLAQGYDTTDASVLGVYLHGKAGDQLTVVKGAHGVLPSELPETIGKLLG